MRIPYSTVVALIIVVILTEVTSKREVKENHDELHGIISF
jgi:hypothetical protein